MANIRTLTSKNLSEVSTSNSFLYLQNIATGVDFRMSLSELASNAVSVGYGIPIYNGVVSSRLTFKTLISLSSAISLSSSSDGHSVNISLLNSNIDLNTCSNTTSLFLQTVDLATNVGATILPVANGGTGVTTLTDGGILLGSGTGAITAMAALAAGSIIQGDGTTDPAVLAIGTAGKVLTVNSGATALEWATAGGADNLGNHTATTILNMSNNNIDLGSGTINYTGADVVGLTFDSSNQAHIIPTGGTATGGTSALNLSGDIFLKGDANRIINVGTPASGVGSTLQIFGSSAGTSSSDGGSIVLKAGATTTGTGGDLRFYPGASTSQSAGDVTLYTTGTSNTAIPILRVTPLKRVSIQNSTGEISPTALLDVRQTEVSGAIPVLNLTQSDIDIAFAQFNGTAAAASTTNLSTSTATAAAKTGAIKVLIKDQDGETSVAWIRVWASAV
tara:strand:- start:466 stop:1809 length:1344 start_codon:yes stop_codon:yes gene_type:complete